MSKSYSIGDLMAMYYENEFSAIEEIALPKFSAKHNRKMNRAFNAFVQNRSLKYNQATSTSAKRPFNIRKRILIAAIIIICLAVSTGCVIAFTSNSFRGTVYNDNTYLFAFDIGDSPTVIEEEYTLSVVPEGYKLYKTSSSSINKFTVYRNNDNEELIFQQTVKSKYNSHINTEGYLIEEIEINNCDAICVEYERKTGISSAVIWNSDEYILELHGNFAKEELIDLAKCNEIESF